MNKKESIISLEREGRSGRRLKITRRQIPYLLSVGLLISLHIALFFMLNERIDFLVNSDASSELVLSKILSEEKRIITDSWNYSTELQFLNVTIIYAFFFLFFKDWHVVRMLSILVSHLILTGSTIYLCRQAGLKKYAPAAASVMLLSFSTTGAHYFWVVLEDLFYLPYISISFISLGLCLRYGKIIKNNKKILLVLLSLALSCAAGVGGLRQIAVTYLPLFICMLLITVRQVYIHGWANYKASKFSRYTLISIIDFLGSSIGYYLNVHILSKRYSFFVYDKFQFTELNLDNPIKLVNDILYLLGYQKGPVNAKTFFSGAFCAVVCLLIFWSIVTALRRKDSISEEYRVTSGFFLCSMVVFFMIYTVTNMGYTERYVIPFIAMGVMSVMFVLKEADFGKLKVAKKTVCICLMSAALIQNGLVLSVLNKVDRTKEIREIATFLDKSDYKTGYSTYWNGNVLTELSNGEIDMYALNPSALTVLNFSDLHVWLQKKSHFEYMPEGKIFLLLENTEIESCSWRDKLRDEDIILQTDNRTVYGYDSYEHMLNVLCV